MPKTSPDAPDGGPTLTFHDLIIIAVEALGGGRKGSSVQAIKKYILVQYGVEVSAKNNHHFKRGLKTALEEESLIRVTGAAGATGSFRLPSKSKQKSPTSGNATTRTTRKKSPLKNVTSAMNKMTVCATEQPGTSTGATKTQAKRKMVADDPGEVPSTREPVMNAATARSTRIPAPSRSKGENKNLQTSAATSRTATAKTQPVASRPAAVKAAVILLDDESAPGSHDDDVDEDQVATENEGATEDEAGTEDQVNNEQVTEDEDAQEGGDGTKDENVMEYTDDDEEEYDDANQNGAATFDRFGRAALGNEEKTLDIPNTHDEDEESDVEESEDEGMGSEGTSVERMEDNESAADDEEEDPYRFVFIRVPDEDEGRGSGGTLDERSAADDRDEEEDRPYRFAFIRVPDEDELVF